MPAPSPSTEPAGPVAVTGTESGCTTTVDGTIEPLGPVSVTGTATCRKTEPGDTREFAVPGLDGTPDTVSETIGRVTVCTETASDPRVAGTSTVAYNMREAADGSWMGHGGDRECRRQLDDRLGRLVRPRREHRHSASRAVGMGGHAGSTYIQSITLHADSSTTSSGTIDPSP